MSKELKTSLHLIFICVARFVCYCAYFRLFFIPNIHKHKHKTFYKHWHYANNKKRVTPCAQSVRVKRNIIEKDVSINEMNIKEIYLNQNNEPKLQERQCHKVIVSLTLQSLGEYRPSTMAIKAVKKRRGRPNN